MASDHDRKPRARQAAADRAALPSEARGTQKRSPGAKIGGKTAARLALRAQAGQLQAKLAVGAPGDGFEDEADEIAAALAGGSDPPPPVRRVAATPNVESAPDAVETTVAAALARGGAPLDGHARSYFEPHLRRDLADVRIHTDAEAAKSVASLGARAYTVGTEIAFSANAYAPNTAAGSSLLAHELVHVVQQSAAPPIVQRQQGDDLTAMSATEETMRGLGDADVQRQILLLRGQLRSGLAGQGVEGNLTLLEAEARRRQLTVSDANVSDTQQASVLAGAGLVVEPEDVAMLVHLFPQGLALERVPLTVAGFSTSAAAAARTQGYRATTAEPLETGVVAYILRVGHGRSIVVASRGGPAVMLDAGTGGGLRGAAAQGLTELVQAGLTSPPARIQISHTDADHINEVGRILRAGGMATTTVEIGLQQYRNRIGQGDWARAGIALQPGQSLIEINVVDNSGVHRQQRVFGNMEVTELRLIAPAQRLGTTGLSTSQYRAQKNASSPVTVVRDLVTGDTMVFTADGEGHVLGQIIDIVGEGAFRDLLGGAGATLRAAEYPHHGGMVGPGDAARGIVRMLRLQFEASRGDAALFTQTTQRFAAGASASIRVLDQVGVPVQRVTDTATGTAPGTSVVQLEAGRLSEVTIDQGVVQQVVQIGRPAETELMSAQSQRARLAELRSQIEPLRDVVSSIPQRAAIAASLTRLLADAETQSATLDTSWRAYWQALEGASAPAPGMRAGIDLTAVNTAVTGLRTATANDPVRRLEESYRAHENLLTTEIRLLQNAFLMFDRLNRGDYRAVGELRAVQAGLLGEATRVLGRSEVEEHVRSAWAETEAMWTARVMRSVVARLGETAAQRQMQTRFGAALGESLAARLRMQEIVEQAGAGMSGPVAPRTRVAAGFMLFIELTRIGLELANQYRVASEAAEVERANVEIRGRNMVQWWLDRGVVPRVALVTEDNDIVPNLTQEQIYDILHGRFTGATPTYARVVVTDVSHDERLLAVANLQLEAVTLDDWYRLVEDDRRARQEHGWTPFLRFENRWHTLVWVASDKEYRASFDQEVADRLESLHASLRTNLEQQLQLEAGPASSIKTVRDTSWVGSPNRYVYVYFDSGNFGPIDFGAVTPRFRVLGREWPTNREMTLVQAADTDTWLRLREYRWPTSQTWIGENSSGRYYRRNTAATAYVENDDLVPL